LDGTGGGGTLAADLYIGGLTGRAMGPSSCGLVGVGPSYQIEGRGGLLTTSHYEQ
jgi:hypothetical protein